MNAGSRNGVRRNYYRVSGSKDSFDSVKLYIIEGFFDQDPALPNEWIRLNTKVYKSKSGAESEARFQLDLGKRFASRYQTDPLAWLYSKTRTVCYTFTGSSRAEGPEFTS